MHLKKHAELDSFCHYLPSEGQKVVQNITYVNLNQVDGILRMSVLVPVN